MLLAFIVDFKIFDTLLSNIRTSGFTPVIDSLLYMCFHAVVVDSSDLLLIGLVMMSFLP